MKMHSRVKNIKIVKDQKWQWNEPSLKMQIKRKVIKIEL